MFMRLGFVIVFLEFEMVTAITAQITIPYCFKGLQYKLQCICSLEFFLFLFLSIFPDVLFANAVFEG